jgi:hypothetical protein
MFSAVHPTTDITKLERNVRKVPKGDIVAHEAQVAARTALCAFRPRLVYARHAKIGYRN